MIVSKQEIAPAVAMRLVELACAQARENGWEVAAAVCDPAGEQVAFLRTDRVIVPAVGFALDKAYTAATLRKSTKAFFERAEGSASLSMGLANRPRLMTWSGGVALFHDGQCIGGLGVSGAQDFEDVACAMAAIEAVGLEAG